MYEIAHLLGSNIVYIFAYNVALSKAVDLKVNTVSSY